MLRGRRVLIVEDESLLAIELADIVEDSHGHVVGPFRTNRDALRSLDSEAVDAAILDLNLADGESTPTAERLMAAGIPVLVCTAGTLPRAMRLQWPDMPIHRKPVRPDRLVDALRQLCVQSDQAASGAAPTSWRACSTVIGSPKAAPCA